MSRSLTNDRLFTVYRSAFLPRRTRSIIFRIFVEENDVDRRGSGALTPDSGHWACRKKVASLDATNERVGHPSGKISTPVERARTCAACTRRVCFRNARAIRREQHNILNNCRLLFTRFSFSSLTGSCKFCLTDGEEGGERRFLNLS